jgi:hypothetical protein
MLWKWLACHVHEQLACWFRLEYGADCERLKIVTSKTFVECHLMSLMGRVPPIDDGQRPTPDIRRVR